jgi:hypothetical protein
MADRIVFVEGMTGSGKSTTAHYIARRLRADGMDARWYHEEEPDHPLAYANFPRKPSIDLYRGEEMERYLKELPEQWSRFASEWRGRHGALVSECHLLQNALVPLAREELDRAASTRLVGDLLAPFDSGDPLVIYFYRDDVPAGLRLNWERRGKEWRDWYVTKTAEGRYAKRHGLDGETAAFRLWTDIRDRSLEALRSWGGRTLLIETSSQDWGAYRAMVDEALGLPPRQEEARRKGDEACFGTYLLEYEEEDGSKAVAPHRVYETGGRMRMDAFWPGLYLLPVGEDRWTIEGFPFEFRFVGAESGRASAMEVAESTFFYERGWTLPRAKDGD